MEQSANSPSRNNGLGGVLLALGLFCSAGWVASEQGPSATEPRTAERGNAQPVADTVAVASRLIAAGEPEKALALLRRAMRAEGADTVAIRFLAARALLSMGRRVEAVTILGQLAQERPDLDRVRLDYAAILFTLGRDAEARAVFQAIRRKKGLPPAVRRNVERFLEYIRTRQRLRIDLDFGFWHDNNVNNASEREAVAVPQLGGLQFTLDEQPVRAWVARTGAGLRWREPLTKNRSAYIETRTSVVRNWAIDKSEHDRTWAILSTGPRKRYAVKIGGRRQPGLLRADVGGLRRWRSNRRYYDALSFWTGLGWQQAIATDWRVGGFARYWITRFDQGQSDQHPPGRSFGFHVERRLGPGYLAVGQAFLREKPQRPSLRWKSREAWVAYDAGFGRDWNLGGRIYRAGAKFDGEHPLFGKRRRDRTYAVEFTVSHRALARRGYLPELVLGWTRTRSNIPLYDQHGQAVRLGLRKLF